MHYDNIGELVASADAVAIGRVADTSRSRVLDQEDVVFTIKEVRVVVERLLAGRMSIRAFTIEQPGWEKAASEHPRLRCLGDLLGGQHAGRQADRSLGTLAPPSSGSWPVATTATVAAWAHALG